MTLKNPLVGVNVEVDVFRIITDTSSTSTRPICDSDYRKTILGTREFFRLDVVCKAVLSGYTGVTDNFGTYNFDSFTVLRGPEALYAFQVRTTSGTTIYSDLFYIYMVT